MGLNNLIHKENGTLWVWDTGHSLPPTYEARFPAAFGEATAADLEALAEAMDLPSVDPILQRLAGPRRCFIMQVENKIVTYGWVTCGAESVGELERRFNLTADEAYVWDCRTVPGWRGRGCYSALLNQIIYRLAAEGLSRIWIGASRQNRPSVQGFINAGFQPVLDLIYRRIFGLTFVWLQPDPAVDRQLFTAASNLLLNDHERRWGRLFVGIKMA